MTAFLTATTYFLSRASYPLFFPGHKIKKISAKSERIAYREMESQRFSKRSHIVITAMTGVVRSMYAYTEVASDDKHRYVDTKIYRPKREIAQESRRTQCAAGTHRVRLEQPHVAGIQENSSMHRAENRKRYSTLASNLKVPVRSK